ncbi:MAG: DUF58 domain-containing protein [Flavobacteriales bacterium]
MRYLLFLFKAIYFRANFFIMLGTIVLLFVLGFFYAIFQRIAQGASIVFSLLVLGELFLLFNRDPGVKGERETADEWSNGDENPVRIRVTNRYPMSIKGEVIDEAPPQTQLRDLRSSMEWGPGATRIMEYHVIPRERGRYRYGKLNVFVRLLAGTVARRHRFPMEKDIQVLPAFKRMRSFEFLAVSDRLTEMGVRPIRRLGESTEFERIRPYVQGDDRRAVNWKASARKDELMVNEYREERSQEVFSLIDTGRVMEMPFEGMTLLDHAINASLVLSNIAMVKKDRPGLLTFSYRPHRFIQASSDPIQMRRIMENLHDLDPDYLETDMERLYLTVRKRVPQRSLLLLFTNISSMSGLERMAPPLRMLARSHTVLVVLFRNTELEDLFTQDPEDARAVHDRAVAEDLIMEKERIAKELERYGILVLSTRPEKLTVNVINKYLELKAKRRV